MLYMYNTPISRLSASYRHKRYGSSYGGLPLPGQVGPPLEVAEEVEEKSPPREDEQTLKWKVALFKMIESAATTFMSIMVLGLVLLKSTRDQSW